MPRNIRIVGLSVCVMLCCVLCRQAGAQEEKAPQLVEFEVASIKPVILSFPHAGNLEVYPGGRIVISGWPLKALVACAFNLPHWQVKGDATTEEEDYYVEAKPPADAGIKTLKHTLSAVEDGQLREMLQTMLIDRFQLKFHREENVGNVYVLTRNGKPLRLQPRKRLVGGNRTVAGSIGNGGRKWVLFNTTVSELARFASENVLHAPVLDQTGLEGTFDYRQTVPESEAEWDHNSSFLRFIAELGLKVEKARGRIESLVIDSAAKPVG